MTKGNQWIRLNKTLELLDTPGILWPRFEDQRVGLLLAMIGSINDEILNKDELAVELIRLLMQRCPETMTERYKLDGMSEEEKNEPGEILAQIARARGCLKKGGEPDYSKASAILIEDFRSGRLGRITLELPPRSDESDKTEVKATADKTEAR